MRIFLYMKHRIISAFIIGATTALTQLPAVGHTQGVAWNDRAQRISPRELDSLTAPIALYPDQLLADIMMAATYPGEVQDAADWVAAPYNSSLRGSDLEEAMDRLDWDPSIKSLVTVPGLLQMMATNIEWTERLGNAFIGNEDAVMDSVQRLRQEAFNRGSLRTDNRQRVIYSDGLITIEPARSDSFYFSVYDPRDVYGDWRYPEYPPYYFSAPVGYGIGMGYGYGISVPIFRPYWGWHNWDWRGHRINIDRGRWDRMSPRRPHFSGNVWQHDTTRRDAGPRRDNWRGRTITGGPPQGRPSQDRAPQGQPWQQGQRPDAQRGDGQRGDAQRWQGQDQRRDGRRDGRPMRDVQADDRRDDNGRGRRQDWQNRRGQDAAPIQQPAAQQPVIQPPPQQQQRGDDNGRGRGRQQTNRDVFNGGDNDVRNNNRAPEARAPEARQPEIRTPQGRMPASAPIPEAASPQQQEMMRNSSPALRYGLHGGGRPQAAAPDPQPQQAPAAAPDNNDQGPGQGGGRRGGGRGNRND